MSDPFVGTLVALPLVLVGLGAVEAWLRRRQVTVASPVGNALQAASLALLVLLVLGRGHLGLVADSPGLDAVLAGGLFALLAIRVAALVHGLGQGQQRTRPAWPFFVLPLVVYLAVLPWGVSQRGPDGDEPYFLLITHSLVHDFDTELTNNYSEQHSLAFSSRVLEPEWADPVRADGSVYSRHSLFLPLLLAPGYLVAGKWGALVTMAMLASWMAWLSLYLIHRYGVDESGSAPVAVWALLALTPPALLYANQIWVEVPAAILLLLSLHQVRSLEDPAGSSRRHWVMLALTLVLLPLLKLRFVLLAVPVLVLAGWRGGRTRRTVLWAGLALAVALGGILLFNAVVFGNPFKDHTLTQLLQIQGRSPLDYLRGFSGLFWDGAFGLFASNPLWLLLIPAAVWMLWQRSRLLIELLVVALPYLLIVTPRREWYGAWSPPFRFGMVLLPLLALLLVPLMQRRDRAGARGLLTALGWVALALMILWVVVPGWTYNLAVGTDHLTNHLSVRWAADMARLTPSMTRPRAATWVVPILASASVMLLWWVPRRRLQRVGGGWAAALALLAVAALPLAATRIPTTTVEFEDRQVLKTGGELYPGPWEPFRPRYRGGWKLAVGQSVQVPVVPGGKEFALEVDLVSQGRVEDDAEVRVFAGTHLLGSWPLGTKGGWRTLALEGDIWPERSALRLEVLGTAVGVKELHVILDRARFAWR